MSSLEEAVALPEGFSGRVRLFPLPNLVLFPHVMQPLHVFEPRYREMLEDAVAKDQLITMAVLAPGWEADYEGRPAIHPFACLGRITTHCRLSDGTYNLLLLGLRRVKVVRELPPERAFREADVAVCEDVGLSEDTAKQADLRRELQEALLGSAGSLREGREQVQQFLGAETSLAVLTDVLAYMLDLSMDDRLALLGEANVARRTEILLSRLKAAAADSGFPPRFSAN